MQPAPPFEDFDPTPAPGGARRFLVSIVVAALVLGGVVVGMIYWMGTTPLNQTSQGPRELKFPDKRPYR